MKERVFNSDKFKIGIKWQGNTYYDIERVITIESFYKLMEMEKTQFYSCQTFEGAEEYKKIIESILIEPEVTTPETTKAP